ncbi:MAG: DUF2867 domain-containing protein [Aquihabitans sp.]
MGEPYGTVRKVELMRHAHKRHIPASASASAERLRQRRPQARVDDRAGVRRIDTPAGLISAAGLPRVDFTDTFSLRLPRGSSRNVEDWQRALITAGTPVWVGALMTLRNRVARGLGLDTAGGSSDPSPFTLLRQAGDSIVVGADDKHLDFRGVLRVVGDDLQCATVVQKHNATGRAYFAVVKPFHRLIVPAMLRRARAGATR